MRIIGGQFKRRLLPVNTKLKVRPTTDIAKEALFNILNNYFDFTDIEVLDIFAGTGSISAEFASRGALNVLSVDNNLKCILHINNIVNNFNFNNFTTIKSDSLNFLNICNEKYDIIFADPPFDYQHTGNIVEAVFKNELLKTNGWLIIEHPASVKLNDNENFFDHRKYGKVNFSFFKNKE